MKVAIYTRVSTHYQIDKVSLPLQLNELINYSKYVLGIDDYEIFEDVGYFEQTLGIALSLIMAFPIR